MTALRDQRLRTALISRGISGEEVYRLTHALCRELDLGRDLLDFGAGQGRLAADLLARGYGGAVTCADIQPRPAALPEAVRWIDADLNDPLPLLDGSFDAIISNEVLPSLENPRFLFREFFRLLRPQGTLLLTQPNHESLRSYAALVFGGYFAALPGAIFPGPITALLRSDFRRLCAETGFDPPRFCYTGAGGLPRLPGLHWQRLSFGLLRGRLFSDNLALLTRKR